MYGSLALGESLDIGGVKISFLEGDIPRYVRDGYERHVAGVDRLMVHPAPPIYLPILGLFRHVMIPISPAITVAPGGEVSIEKSVLVDVAVSTPTEEPQYIDVFPMEIPKMAVYGRSADGILCRYLFEGDGAASVKVKINIRSDCRFPITISKVVVPTSLFKIFYIEGSVEARAADLNLVLECDVGVVRVGKYPEGYKPVPMEAEQTLLRRMQLEPGIIKRILTQVEEFIMDRGF